MSLAAGARLGPYEILSLLGAGGMGEVYRAKDTRLGRDVAVKVLPAGMAVDPDRRRRFEQEARAASALNHPHICVIHDVGSERGVDFLVMEYLDGQSLAERLRKGPLPTGQVLELGLQIASALDRAHREGIVHRDLKPGNVMLTKSGAKLLDFGLAKLRCAGPLASANESAIPTEGPPITDQGAILGTLSYMSPEQLEGKAVDTRSDLFSFGAVLYEMLTGQRAFEGTSAATLITKIMSSDPPSVSARLPLTPPGLDRLVRKCLAKDPDARWQSASDLADEFRWLSSGSGSASGPAAAASAAQRRGGVWRWVAGGAVAVALVAGGGGWWWTRRRAAAPDVAAKHTQVTFSGDVIATALSSDGRSIADLVGTQGEKVRVLVRDLGAGQPLQVWEGVEATCLTWTPDGLQVLIAGPREGDKGQAIHIVPRLGGAARRLPVTELVASMAVSPDGRRLATVNGGFAGATVVSLESGKQDRIPVPGAQYTWGVDWSPVTNRLVVVSLDKENHPSVSVVGADGSGLRRVYGGKEQIRAVSWSRAEDVLYLMRRRGRATELLRLSTAGGDSSAPQLLMGGLPPGGSFQISADGQRLLHTRLTGEANLFRVDLEARGGAPIAITKGTWELGEPHVSPDGRWISATRGGEEIVRFPIEGGEPVVLTNGADGVWSPDGKRLAFASDRGGTLRPYVADADGQRANEIPGADDLASPQLRWFSDRQLAWHRPDNHDFRIRDLEIGREESLVKDPSAGFVFGPCLSPKGDQVAVLWNRVPGFKEGLWLISWPGREERLVAPDLYPFGWSADGKWIYATSEIAPELVRVSPATGAIEVIVRFDAAHADLGGCDLTPDRRSVICSAGLGKMDAWLIEHFDPHVPPSGR